MVPWRRCGLPSSVPNPRPLGNGLRDQFAAMKLRSGTRVQDRGRQPAARSRDPSLPSFFRRGFSVVAMRVSERAPAVAEPISTTLRELAGL